MDRRRIVRVLILLAVLAFGLRCAAFVGLKSWRMPSAMEHQAIATALVGGEGFSFGDFGYFGPTSVQSPLFPFLLAAAYKVFGTDSAGAYAAVMALNAVVGAGVVVLTYSLARTLGGSARTGLIAAGLCAVWPTQVYAVTVVQAIVMIVAAQIAMVVLFYRGVRTGKRAPWVGFSVIACLGALTEPVLLPISALTGLLILVWPGLEPKLRVRNAAVLLAAAVLIIGPWSVRNRLVHGVWVPIKSTFWVNVWKGANDYATGTDRLRLTPEREAELKKQMLSLDDESVRNPDGDTARQYDQLTPEQRAELWGKNETDREKVFKKYAQGWIAGHRGEYARLCLTRLGKTLWVDWDNPKSFKTVYVVSRGALLVGTVIGLVLALRRRWTLTYPALLVGSCVLTYTLTLTAARFSIPFEPLQLCFCALVIVTVWEWATAKASENRVGMVSAALEAT